MKIKHLLTFSLIFLLTVSFCQERITDLVSENTTARYFIHEIDEVKYLLEINQDSRLAVSILNEDFSLITLHSRVIEGLFKDHFIKFDGSVLYALDDITPIIYNFVQNTEVVVDMPTEWIPRYWRYGNGDLAMVWCSDIENDEYRNFLVNVEGEVLSSAEDIQDIQYIYGNYYFKRTAYISSDVRTYYLEHIETGVKDTIMNEVRWSRLVTHGDNITYLDGDGHIITMNTITGEKVMIPGVEYDEKKVYEINVKDDLLFIEYNISQGKEVIHMHDLYSGHHLNTFEHEELDDFNLSDISIANNKLITLTFWYLITFDLDTGEGLTYISDYNDVEIPTIDDRYIFNTNQWQSTFIDLETGEESVILGDYEIRPYDYAKIIPVGDIHLGIFRSDNQDLKSMYKLDVANNSIEHAGSIENNNEGFDDYYTELIKIGKNLILASNDIYSVEGIEVTKVNPYIIKEVDFMPYKKRKEYVTFLCEDGTEREILYSYDGQNINEEAEFDASTSPFDQLRIVDYIITAKNVFYIATNFLDGGLFRYNKITKEITKLSDYQGLNFVSPFSKSGEDVYYTDDKDLYHLDENGVLTFIKTNIVSHFLYSLTIELKDKCYNLDQDAISLVEGKELIPIITGDFEFGISIYSGGQESNSLLIELNNDGNNKAIYLKGEDAYILEFENRISYISSVDHDHYIIYTTDSESGEIEDFVFNGNTKETYSLNDLELGDRYVDLFFVDDNPFMLTRSFVTNKLYIYQLSSDYSSSSLLHEFSFFLGSSSQATFKAFENEGLLYANELIALMDVDYSLHKLDVKGNGNMTEMHDSEEGFIYFMGNDVIHGNQLYRVLRFSFRVSTEDLLPIVALEIFPNPTSDFIQINENLIGSDYSIIDYQGRTIQNGKMDSEIVPLNFAQGGLYLVKIEGAKNSYRGTFYKN